MWCVEPPALDVGETFETCISRVRNNQKNNFLKDRFEAIQPTILTEAAMYAARAANNELHLIAVHDNVGGTVTTKEMVSLYDGRMVKENALGRAIYTKIKLLPEHDRCPFCDHRDVSTLDHILPKTLFPVFAVTPLNLVGSCKDCNKAKSTQSPEIAATAVLHPYFDDVSDQTWLRARVIEADVCAVTFRVKHRDEWCDEKNARLKAQFKTLGLNRLYSNQAAREMSGIRESLIRKFEAGGEDVVRRELTDQWRSRQADRRNSWQTALYRALSRSDWYCERGFRLGQ